MKIAVLHSGDINPDSTRPDEYETVQTCEDIEISLEKLGHSHVRVHFDDDLGVTEAALKAAKADLVFNMVETARGTDRLSYLGPAVCENLGLAYTGCPTSAIAVAASKIKVKRIMVAAGVPTPDFFERGGQGQGGPWIVKSVTEHASMGVDIANIVNTSAEAAATMDRLAAGGGEWFAEKFVTGREYNVYMLSKDDGAGMDVLGVSELVFNNQPAGKPNVYDYAAKWHFDSPDYDAVGRDYDVVKPLADAMAAHGRALWNALDLRGAARLDFRVDEAGQPYVIDVNLNPCMSTGCIFAEAAARVGVTYDDIIRRLVTSAKSY